MYSFLKQLGPDQVGAIACQLYCEMLKNGYTAVAEFHYLHTRRTESPTQPRRNGRAAPARRAAHRHRDYLLPSLYAYGNFGEEPLAPAQKRCDDADRFSGWSRR